MFRNLFQLKKDEDSLKELKTTWYTNMSMAAAQSTRLSNLGLCEQTVEIIQAPSSVGMDIPIHTSLSCVCVGPPVMPNSLAQL